MNNKAPLLFAFLFCCLTQEAFCPIFGFFQGIDKFIESSDAILVIHITKAAGEEKMRQPYMEYDVFVEKTLKGNVPERHASKLFLRYLPLGLISDGLFPVGSRHLVFLSKPRPETNNLFSNINCEGSHIELSTHGNVMGLDAANLKKTVVKLFQEAQDFHQAQADALKHASQDKSP